MTTAQAWAERNTAWWNDAGPVAALDVGLALTFADFEGAFRLLHDQFVAVGYMTPSASGRRFSLHNLLPSTKVFVARAERRVVGTLTVVEDSRLGLPMDEAFGPELGQLRARGRRIAEAGALGIDPSWRAEAGPILVRLLRAATLYATQIARAHDLGFVVHPKHDAFYRRIFPFQRFDGVRSYRRSNDTLVIGLRLDLGLVRALIRTERAGLSAGPHTAFLCGPEAYRTVMARLRRELPRSALMPTEWARLFATADDDAGSAMLDPESARPRPVDRCGRP